MNLVIMPSGNLEDILGRLSRCCALLDVLTSGDTVSTKAVAGVRDLLQSVYTDFRADIEGSDEYVQV